MEKQLEVKFYFFVFTREVMAKEHNKFGVTYFNDDIGVKCIMSGGEADDELEKLLKFKLIRGLEFVDGIFNGFTGIDFIDNSTKPNVDFFKNDWLKFEVDEKEGKCLVRRI
jgi:hypothetical protein